MYQMPDNHDRAERESRQIATRVVMDAHGNEWVVREVETPQAWAHGDRCLIFSSPSIVRRIWRYPADWSRLSSRELLDLAEDTASA